MFLEKALNVLFLEHLLKERCLCTFVQFSIWNGVYAVCRRRELQREQLLLLLLLLPFELQREHVFCAGHVRGVGVATVFAHKTTFKAQ